MDINWDELFSSQKEVDEAIADGLFSQIGDKWFCNGNEVSETIVYDYIYQQEKNK